LAKAQAGGGLSGAAARHLQARSPDSRHQTSVNDKDAPMSLRDFGTVKETTVVTIIRPDTRKPALNADKTPMTVTLHGPYSKRYRSILRAQQQKRAMDASITGEEMSPDDLETFSTELLIGCIEDWSITLEGDTKLPFSREAAESVLAEFPWLKDQLSIALMSSSNFLAGPNVN
jgi:hypothetical protein